jgi:hypothetical protein
MQEAIDRRIEVKAGPVQKVQEPTQKISKAKGPGYVSQVVLGPEIKPQTQEKEKGIRNKLYTSMTCPQ